MEVSLEPVVKVSDKLKDLLNKAQIVPIGAAALRSVKLVKNATLKIYPGAPHGLAYTHKDQLNADLLAFIKI